MSENRCVCCGAVIPEGTQVCPKCTKEYWNHEARRKPNYNDRTKRIMEDWVYPILLVVIVVIFCIFLSKTS